MKNLVITKEEILKMHRRSSRQEAIASGAYMRPTSHKHVDRRKESSKRACKNFKFV